MAIGTYLELKEAIRQEAKRGDIESRIDDFISLAEADIWTQGKLREMEARATATADNTSRFLALPDNFLKMRKLHIINGEQYYPLTFETPETMDIQSAGRPKAFAVTSQLEFDRIPDSAYTVEMQYYRDFTALDATNSTNSVLTNHPSLYLYGSMYHFARWAHDDVLLANYAGLFDGEIQRTNKNARRGRFGPAPAMRTEASTP